MHKFLLSIVLSFSFIFAQVPNTWWVDGVNGSDNYNGYTEATAFKTIQKVFDSYLLGNYTDTIKVKPGTYDFSDDYINNANKSFIMIGTGGASQTIFDADRKNRIFQISFSNIDDVTIFEGITFRNGLVEKNDRGGAVAIWGSSKVDFKNCIFEKNKAGYAGGAVSIASQAVVNFDSCVFTENEATNRGGALDYEEVYNDNDLRSKFLKITNSEFSKNSVKPVGGGFGGAIHSNRQLEITNGLFVNNFVENEGNSDNNDLMGGAINVDVGSWDNNLQQYVPGDTRIISCTFDGNYVNRKDNGPSWGGTISHGLYSGRNSKTLIFNTIVSNSGVYKNGSVYRYNNRSSQAPIIGSMEDQFKLYIDYSNIQGSSQSDWDGAGNQVYDIDPGYKNKSNQDYSLSDKSPIIGMGSLSWNDWGLNSPNTDITGASRPSPANSNPDIGAYENPQAAMSGPLPPTNFFVKPISYGAKLTWSPSSKSLSNKDLQENIEYKVFQNGQRIATLKDTAYTVTGLQIGSTHTFSVSALKTDDSSESIPVGPFTVTTAYLGPWHVAASGGKSPNDANNNSEYGSRNYPINHLTSAYEVATAGDTIVMLEGTHTGVVNRNINMTKQLVITGDLTVDPEKVIIDAEHKSRHFVFDFDTYNVSPADSNWVIQHLTLFRGKASYSQNNSWEAAGGSIRIRNDHSPKFFNVIFRESIDESGYGFSGAAILATGSSSLIIDKCQFINNTSRNEDGDIFGGAIGINAYDSKGSQIRNSIFNGNQSIAKYNSAGSAVATTSPLDIINTLIINNTTTTQQAAARGAVFYEGLNTRNIEHSIFVNNTIANNKTVNGFDNTSGIFIRDYDYYEQGSPDPRPKHTIYAFNNIIYGNQVSQFVSPLKFENADLRADYNLIQNLQQGLIENPNLSFDYTYDFDPAFNDTANGDYSLSDQSLAIGKGTGVWDLYISIRAPVKDLLGKDRPFPSGTNPDLGAYENNLGKSPYPPVVQGLVGKGGSGQVTLNWNALTEADSVYKIYQGDQAFTELSNERFVAKTTSTTYTATGLDNAKRYYFKITAVNKAGYEGTPASIDISPTHTGPVWWIAVDGNDNTGDGSVGGPLSSIEFAMEKAASGDTIILKPGTYNFRDITYPQYSHNGITGETSAKTFDKLVIRSEKGASSTIIDALGQGRHFKITSNEHDIDSTFQFIGLTFRGGKTIDRGGSFLIESYSHNNQGFNQNHSPSVQPKFTDCVFVHNSAGNNQTGAKGGAIFIENASAIFENCVFDSNNAYNGGAMLVMGEINKDERSVSIRNSSFSDNLARNDNGYSHGGAISIETVTNVLITNSTFRRNMVEANNGSAMGGAIYLDANWDPSFDNLLEINNSRFTKNIVFSSNQFAGGGGLKIGGPSIIQGTVVDSNLSFTSQGDALGGGLLLDSPSINNVKSSVDLINNTIVNNVVQTQPVNNGGAGGGIAAMTFEQNENLWFNNIIWGNKDDRDDGSGAPIDGIMFNNLGNQNNSGFFNNFINGYNNIQDLAKFEQYYNLYFGENTTSLDPAFKGSGSYQLSDASPLIGAGTISFDSEPVPNIDINGNRRPTPSNSNPDLGAYENSLSKSPYPDAVEGLTAQELTNSVKLFWTANSAGNIKHYNVYYTLEETFSSQKLTKAGETSATNFLVENLTNGTGYHFTVTATDTSNFEGPFSEVVFATPSYNGPNWWVDPNQSQDGDGSFASPFNSIRRALSEIAQRGDTIRIAAGNFSDGGINFSRDPNQSSSNDTSNSGPIKEIVIIGAGPNNTIINAENNRHFNFVDKDLEKVLVSGMTLTNAYSESNGGSIYVDNVDSVTFTNIIFDENRAKMGGGAIVLSAVKYSAFSNVVFNRNYIDVPENSTGQGAAIKAFENPDGGYGNITIANCKFIENGITAVSNNAAGRGSAIFVDGAFGLHISQSEFKRNNIDSRSFASSLIAVYYNDSVPLWSDFPPFIIDRSLFEDNMIYSSVDVGDSFLSTNRPLYFVNNLVVNNFVPNNNNAYQMILMSGPADQGGNAATSFIESNTFYGNSGNNAFMDVSDDGYLNFINNIVWSNNTVQARGSTNRFKKSNNATIYAETNILQSNVEGNFTSVNNIESDPKLRNPESGDYRLQGNSPAIDAGTVTGNTFDYRGYYRTGNPDIGAFEAGASKYILAIEDDIIGNKDTTFVSREDTLEFTVTTNDIEGNLVSSNESVVWNIFPSGKYVDLISSDATTSGGSATAKFKVSDKAKGKGFRFRIEAQIGEGIMRSEMYVIEELVTGAPPPVPNLSITPNTWSTEPNFTISWTIPNWSEGRDLLGAIVEIDDGINFYDEFIGFPENNPLKAYAFSVPEPGAFNASIRLMDEYGNENPDSSKTIQALFDNVNPAPFIINEPNSYTDQNGNILVNWVSDKPRFEWQDSGDYPSGIQKWIIFVNGNVFGEYDKNDVEFVDGNAAIVDTSQALEDGFYEWHVLTIDYANNATDSDTAYFGVDLNPPMIFHNNPLTSVDEGSTTPSINVQVSDPGSGVKDVFLNYRRSGSNSGFVSVQLWNNGEITPSSIPGGDIRSEGVEYFIEAIDELGNRSEWPLDYNGNFVQSVVARTQNNVTTADYWSAGIPTGTDTSAYQLFSIPFNTNKGLNAITEVLGPPDEFKYRLYGWNNGWNEFTELNPINISLGDAYFFIWDKDKYPDLLQLNFDFGKGESTPTSPPFEIPAAVGEWKFFGNPYNFPVNLINVRTQADIPISDEGSIFTWSTFGGWTNPGSVLDPWKGYIYKSATDPDIYVDGTGDVFGKRLTKTTTPEINNISMDVDEWVVNILASTGRSRDESNSVGVLKMASDGYDRLDEFEPPLVPGNISLSIDNRDRDEVPDIYSVDIRKPNDEGHYWDLEIIAPTNGQRTYLTFEGLGYVPEEYDIFIINKTNKQAQNLKWESGYRFANTGSGSYLKQDLRLVIGSKKFVEQNNAGVSLYPDAFVLSQNYPNPFNPQTSIKISLQEEARVDLVVYNLLGEEITRLSSNELRPAGYYNFIWNGMNTAGNKVSTGVYLYHAMVKDKNGKMVLNKTKKMVFLK